MQFSSLFFDFVIASSLNWHQRSLSISLSLIFINNVNLLFMIIYKRFKIRLKVI